MSSGPASQDASGGRIYCCSPILTLQSDDALAMQGEPIYRHYIDKSAAASTQVLDLATTHPSKTSQTRPQLLKLG
jgi:hypothetical protein